MTDRRTQIKEAATRLFLEAGVGVSTAKIAKAAGVSNGTLFNAFSTKQALIDSLYLEAKTEMFTAFRHAGSAAFTRAHLYENWCGYLAWARAHPQRRRIMHLLLDAGLASAETQAQVSAMAAPHEAWIQRALEHGIIRGPGVRFISRLAFFQIDLVLTENLDDNQAELAFDMLCTAIGLTQ